MDQTDGAFFGAYDCARDELPEIVIDDATGGDDAAQRNMRAIISQLAAGTPVPSDGAVDSHIVRTDTGAAPASDALPELIVDTVTASPLLTPVGPTPTDLTPTGTVSPFPATAAHSDPTKLAAREDTAGAIGPAAEPLDETSNIEPGRPNLRVHDPDDLAAGGVRTEFGEILDLHDTTGEADCFAGSSVAGRNVAAWRGGKVPLSMVGDNRDTPATEQDVLSSTYIETFAWPAVCTRWEAAASASLRQTSSWLSAKTLNTHATVAVTSCRHGEGRSSTAMMLARLAARNGLTSVIVDADVQHPGLASQLGLEPTVGWTDALDGTATLAETIIQSAREPIAVVPTLRPLPQFDGLSGNLNLGMHLRMLREQFELVVLDVGPLEETGQTTLIKSLTDDAHVDGVLLVRDVRHTGREEADSLGECLRAASIPVWGVIENFTDAA